MTSCTVRRTATRLLTGLGLLCIATQVSAVDIEGNRVTIGWGPASGPATHYLVYVARNGPFDTQIDAVVEATGPLEYEIEGGVGDVVYVRIAAFNAAVWNVGPYSAASQPIHFVPPSSIRSLISNGSFEQGPPVQQQMLPGNSLEMPEWRVVGHSIDRVGSWQAADGQHTLDLNGRGAGGVRQILDTEPGRSYVAFFSLSVNPGGGPAVRHVRVTAGDRIHDFEIDADGVTSSQMNWRRNALLFEATSRSTSLQFLSLTDLQGSQGPALDNVEVYPFSP